MNKYYIRLSISFCLSFVMLVTISSCSSSNNSNAKEINDGSTQKNTQPIPTFSAEEFKLITDPCTTISIESINLYVPGSKDSGSLQQNSVGPNKTCEWKIDDESFPRLGVSVIQSSNFFNPGQQRIIDAPELGEKVFVAPEYVIVLGGDSCGSTIYVVSGKYSFSVAYCDADGQPTSDEVLMALALQVKNSLPVT